MRAFFAEHETSIEVTAGTLRATMGLSSGEPIVDSAGCDGPMLEAERAESIHRGAAVDEELLAEVVTELLVDGPPDLAAAVAEFQAAGGELRLDTDGLLEAGMIALRVGDDLVVSEALVSAGLEHPASIHATIAHEIAGHIGYGVSLSCVILETALAGTPAMHSFDDYRRAYLTYVYPETEIYAELQELPYDSDVAIGDDPYVDIIVMVQRIRAAYPPELADLILGWIRQRCTTDPTLTSEARFYCEAALSD